MRTFHILVFVLTLLFVAGTAVAGDPQLRISSTEINCDTGTLTLHGEFGDPATVTVIVTLDTGAGPVELMPVGTPTEDTIEVELPNGECAPAGTHRLTVGIPAGGSESVETTTGKVRSVQFYTVLDLTLGAAGPAGAPGAPGSPGGLTGYEQVESQVMNPGNLGTGSSFSVVASCPAGKKVVGGGIRLSGNVAVLADMRVLESIPASDSSWRASAILVGPTPSAGQVTLTAYAVCANANFP